MKLLNGVVMRSDMECQTGGNSRQNDKKSDSFLRRLLVFLGTVFVGLGILGIFIPILPTTPFLLLAAACYARSSKRFYHWLLNNRWFGSYIKNYKEKKSIPLKVKIFTVSLLWITIMLSAIIATNVTFVRIVLIIIALCVTIHILSLRTSR
jgi:uncharacterized membrane protein YbaN (DUF454 family)